MIIKPGTIKCFLYLTCCPAFLVLAGQSLREFRTLKIIMEYVITANITYITAIMTSKQKNANLTAGNIAYSIPQIIEKNQEAMRIFFILVVVRYTL